jgi:squalene cyclase
MTKAFRQSFVSLISKGATMCKQRRAQQAGEIIVRMIMPSLFATIILLSAASSRLAAAEPKMDEDTKKATAKALEWIASKQNNDGSWTTERFPHNTAITSFALLAFMSQGHLPNQGLYGPEVAKGCRFLLASAREDGYLIGARDSGTGNMYCHAMATLALAELWGMTGDDDIKPVLKKAVDFIVRCQSKKGGWRYNPDPKADAQDISVTIMQVMALRAAKNSGMLVPDATMKKALEYIKSLHHADSGGFGYEQPSNPPGFARSAAGICVLQMAGKYDAKEIPKAVEYLKKHSDSHEHFWYGHYYATHAMHQVGGKDWEEWYGKERRLLLSKRSANGSWSDFKNDNVGPVYQTSIAVIILSTPAGYLPIFQR